MGSGFVKHFISVYVGYSDSQECELAEVDFLCGMELDMKGVKNYNNLEIGSKSYWLRGSVLKYGHAETWW